MNFTIRELEAFQTHRLEETYADFIRQPQYRRTCDFFFGQIYTGEDSETRDAAFVAFYRTIQRFVGGDIARCLREMIDLQLLTRDLDLVLHQQILKSDFAMPLSMIDYEIAYAACHNYDQRHQQIKLLVDTLESADLIFHRFGVGTGLKALHAFHKIRIYDLITGFLLEGYHAIRAPKNLKALIRAISNREMERLNRIFDKDL